MIGYDLRGEYIVLATALESAVCTSPFWFCLRRYLCLDPSRLGSFPSKNWNEVSVRLSRISVDI